jgi:hypothetical protein
MKNLYIRISNVVFNRISSRFRTNHANAIGCKFMWVLAERHFGSSQLLLRRFHLLKLRSESLVLFVDGGFVLSQLRELAPSVFAACWGSAACVVTPSMQINLRIEIIRKFLIEYSGTIDCCGPFGCYSLLSSPDRCNLSFSRNLRPSFVI